MLSARNFTTVVTWHAASIDTMHAQRNAPIGARHSRRVSPCRHTPGETFPSFRVPGTYTRPFPASNAHPRKGVEPRLSYP